MGRNQTSFLNDKSPVSMCQPLLYREIRQNLSASLFSAPLQACGLLTKCTRQEQIVDNFQRLGARGGIFPTKLVLRQSGRSGYGG